MGYKKARARAKLTLGSDRYKKKNLKSIYHNIKKNRPLELSKNLASKFWTLARPIFRKYIKSRISRRGAVIEPNEMGNVISLRSEHFIGIDSNSAYKMAINSTKRKK